MNAGNAPPLVPRRVVLLLGGAAGYLDAVGYLTLGLFIANMTGNTVLLGIALGQGHRPAMLRVLSALAAFVAGAAAGAVLLRKGRRMGSVFSLEAACVLAALAAWLYQRQPHAGSIIPGPTAFPLIVLLSAAMGAQSAAVRRVGEDRVSTTYVTGTLTSLAVDTVSEILARREGRPHALERPTSNARTRLPLLGGIWTTYVTGALVGGFVQQHWEFGAIVLPMIVLAGTAVWDLRHP